MREWLRLAFDGTVVRRALMVAAVAGSVLVVVNHGEALLHGDRSAARILKVISTMMIPYWVSVAASVGAIQSARRQHQETSPGRS